ncbi:ABC transporter permease, partial [Enterococcus faecium]
MSEKNNTAVQESIPPLGIRMIARVFKKEKIAIFSLALLVVVLLVIFIGALVPAQDTV